MRWAVLLFAVFLLACGGPRFIGKATPTTVAPSAEVAAEVEATAPAAPPEVPATEEPAPVAAAPVAPVATDPPALAGVLGGSKDGWLLAHGQPTKNNGFDRFPDRAEVFGWPVGADGLERATHVELTFPQEVPVAQAREAAKVLLPRDAQLVRRYTARAGQTVEVFHSDALAAIFHGVEVLPGLMPGVTVFGDEEDGTFIQIAERGSPRTARVVIGVGNNP